jgi:hypothetical protein
MPIQSRPVRLVHHLFVAMVAGFGLGLLLPSGAVAAPGDVVRGKAGDPGNVSVVRSESGLDVEVVFAPEDAFLVEQHGYSGVTVEGCELAEETPGHPWLPTKVINVLIPNGARVLGVEAEAEEVLLAGNVLMYPAQPQVPVSAPLPARPAFVGPDAAMYAAATKVPATVAELAGQHSMRGHTFAAVRIQPVRYVPAARELYLATRITVRLQCSGPQRQAFPPGRVGREIFRSAVAGIVVNAEMVEEEAAAADEAAAGEQPAGLTDYLIITSSALASTFQALADHRYVRNEMTVAVLPLETITATYAGVDTQAKIRACIQDYVTNRGTAYVVLGGDDSIVPDRDCHVSCSSYTESYMPTDLYYAGLNGTWDEDGDGIYGESGTAAGNEGDLAADVYVGRIPVRSAAQATYYINKVIQFDNSPIDSGKMLLMGMHLGGGGSSPYSPYTGTDRPTDTVNDGLLDFASHDPISDTEMWTRRMYRDTIRKYWQPSTLGLFFDTLSSWDPGVPGSYALSYLNIRTQLNLGWYHVFMMTHGSRTSWSVEGGSFNTSDAAALTGRLGFIYTGACLTGQFDGTDPGLCEAFLRDAQGPVAYFGCSRYGWFSPDSPPASNYTTGGTSMDFGRAFYDQYYKVPHNSLAEVFYAHKASKIGSSGYNGAYRWIQFGLNYQGDPALELPLAMRTLTVNAQGQGSVTLNPPGGTYPVATNVLMTAVPTEPWEFARWEGGVTGTANPMMVSMDMNRTVTAVFVLPGDVDGDGLVDVTDLLYLVDAFGSLDGDPNYDARCDFNADGAVDVVDLLTLVETFGT